MVDPPIQFLMECVDWNGVAGRLAVIPTEYPPTSCHVWVTAGVIRRMDNTRLAVDAVPFLAVVPSAVNYVAVTDAGVVTVNQTGWSLADNTAPLAIVTSDADKVVRIEDWRAALVTFGVG